MTTSEVLKIVNDPKSTDEAKSQAIARLGADMLSAQAALGVATSFSPDKFLKDIKSQAAIKADIRFNLAENIVQTFGDAESGIDGVASRLQNLQKEIYDTNFLNSKESALGGLEMTRFFEGEEEIFGKFLDVIENNNSLMTHFTEGVTSRSASRVSLLAGALGFDGDQMQTFLVRQHAMTGKVDTELLKRTLAFSTSIHKKTGLSSKIVAENIAVMMKDVSTFGAMSEKEMARASAAITKMGIKMSSVSSLVNNFNSFEDAAGNVAKLTQALGVQIDVMEVVELSNSGSTTDLIMSLQESFDAQGISVENMNLPMKRLVAGIVTDGDINEMEKMFGKASAGLLAFDDITRDAIEDTSQDDIENAIVRAKDNIRQIQIAKGDMDEAMKSVIAKLSSSLSTALSGTTLEIKKALDASVHKANTIMTKSVKTGMMKGLISAVEDEMRLLKDSVIDSLDDIIDAIEAKDWSRITKALGWLTAAQEKQKKAEAAHTKATKERIELVEQTSQQKFTLSEKNSLTPLPTTTVPLGSGKPALKAIGTPYNAEINNQDDVDSLNRVLNRTDRDLSTRGNQPVNAAELKALIKDLTKAIADGKPQEMKIFYDENGKFNVTKDGKKVVWTDAN